jgi:hypothetical protein
MKRNAVRNRNETSAEEFPMSAGADEKLLFLLRRAVLAPSNHNTQPWLFRIQGHELDIIADLNRSLPVTDPDNRELIISCGAALNHLSVAARYFGYSSAIEAYPEPEYPDLLARFSLGGSCDTYAEDILKFGAIEKRRTYHFPFLPEPVPKSLLDVLEQIARSHGAKLDFYTDHETRYQIAEIVSKADRLQWHDKHFRRELSSWLIPNRSPRRDGIPGYARGVGNLISDAEAFVVRTFDLGEGQAARDREIAIHSPVIAVLSTPADSRRDWLNAGMALSGVLLRAQVEDVSASFLNQAVEVPQTREGLEALLSENGRAQLLLRFGFGKEIEPTPRRTVQDFLLPPRNRPIRIGKLQPVESL